MIPIFFFLLFILVGFGLVLGYLKHQTWSGMTVALFAVSIHIILGLMMQQFWFNVFTYGFGEDGMANSLGIPNNIRNSEYIFKAHH